MFNQIGLQKDAGAKGPFASGIITDQITTDFFYDAKP